MQVNKMIEGEVEIASSQNLGFFWQFGSGRRMNLAICFKSRCIYIITTESLQSMATNGDFFFQKSFQLQEFGTRQTDTHRLRKCFLGTADFFSKIGDSFRFHAVRQYASRTLATGNW